jgi:copper transport protein
VTRTPLAISRIFSTALAFSFALMLLGATPDRVAAHAELVSSTPDANVTLIDSPDEVALTFSEPIDPVTAVVDIVDPGQRTVEGLGEIVVGEGGLTASVTIPDLEPGVYTVSYQVVSSVDGHATAGLFAFLVDPSGALAPPALAPTEGSPSVDAATIIARFVSLAAILVALGSLVTWWRSRRLLEAASAADAGPPWMLVSLASLLAFGGLALYLVLAARPIAAPADPGVLPFDPAAPFGTTPFAIAMRVALAGTLVAAVGAAILTFAGRRVTATLSRGLIPGVAIAAVLAVALGGMSNAAHAASSGGPAFAALDWAHLVAVSAWLGGLPAVAVLARRARGAVPARQLGPAILRHHGPLALVAAPIVVLTGLANSPLVLGASRNLVGSDYGNLLLAKVLLLSVAVAIGAVNHFALRGRGRANVALLVGAELVIATLAVSVAATMVTIQPAAARQPTLQATPVNPAHFYAVEGPWSVHASVNLPVPGPQSFQVTITDRETGAPRDDVQRVFLELTPPAGSDLPASRVELDPVDRPGLYSSAGTYTPLAGEWELEIVVRRRGALDESTSFALPVTSPEPPQLVPPPDSGFGVPAPLAFAWGILPPGLLAWLPAAGALAGVAVVGIVGRRRRVPGAGVVRASLLAILLVSVAGAGSRHLVTAANAPTSVDLQEHVQPPVEPGAIERGEAIFLANCAACHGRDGEGDGPVATLPRSASLAERVPRMSSAELSYRIANGVAGTPMPAFAGRITEAERWQLIAYLEDRWR